MRTPLARLLTGLGLAVVLAPAAQAQVYNTGQGAGLVDPFWSVTWFPLSDIDGFGGPGQQLYDPTVVTPDYAMQAAIAMNRPAPWAPNTETARWISSSSNANLPCPAGMTCPRPGDNTMRVMYMFQTDLLGAQQITGSIGWDNYLYGYKIGNGPIQSFSPAEDFDQFGFCRDGDGEFATGADVCTRRFSIDPAGAQSGDRFSIFILADAGTDGLFIDHAVVPEPSALALLLGGLGTLGAAAARRRKQG